MENISDILPQPKRGRGRPKKYPELLFSGISVAELRGKQNNLHAEYAIMKLSKWNKGGDFDRLLKGVNGKPRVTILSELGRMIDMFENSNESDDKELGKVLSTAAHICKHKLPTAKAIGLIRRIRGVETFPPGPAKLYEVLERSIENFRRLHENISNSDVHRILDELMRSYGASCSKPPLSTT